MPVQVLDPIVGGLRIKKISKVPNSTSPTIVEDYTYEDAGRSSGILYERPYYITSLRSDMVARVGLAAVSSSTAASFPEGCIYFPGSTVPGVPVVISPSSVAPMSSVQGNHVGYSTVRVSQTQNGYSIYRYFSPSIFETNVSDVAYRDVKSNFCDPKSPSFPSVPLPFEFIRGELMAEYHYDSTDQLLKSVNYDYSYDSTKVYTPGIIVKDIPNLATTFGEYNLRGYWKKSIIKKESIIDRRTFKAVISNDTTFFSSPFHRSETRISRDQSTGNKEATNYKYVFDYIPASVQGISDGWTTYQNTCNSCYIDYLNKISASTATAGSKKIDFQTYRMCLAIARKDQVNYRLANVSGPGNSLSIAHLNAKTNSSIDFKAVLEMQDQFINAPVEITQSNNTLITSATYNLFGFELNTSNTYLQSISDIPLNNSVPLLFSPSGNTNTTLTKDSKYEKKFVYASSGGNIVEQSQANGPKDVYLWGYKNKLPVAKISNMDYATISSSVNQSILDNPTSDGQLQTELNRLRSIFPLAHILSYTYNPWVGITSEIDAKGMLTSYEYDAFQRLRTIKDQKGFITKNYLYYSGSSAAPILYQNDERIGYYTKSCPQGQTGSSVAYVVIAGKYSADSKAAANALADAEIVAQGQSNANNAGSCSIPSGTLSYTVKNNYTASTDFTISIDGYNGIGQRSVAASSTLSLTSGLGPVNPSTLLVTVYPAGHMPTSALAQGFWGNISGVINASARTITFSGLNLTVTQSFNIIFN
jgi:YD repeat-containing protein